MQHRLVITACAVGTFALSSAWAVTDFGGNAAPAGAHYRQGSGEPTCQVTGLSVSCTGTQIAGVGNTDADLVLSVAYSATVQCRNHGGKIVEVKTQLTTSSSSDDFTDVRNGTLYVLPVSNTAPSEQSLVDAATCPNGNWTRLLVEGSAAVQSYSYTLTFIGYTMPVIYFTG